VTGLGSRGQLLPLSGLKKSFWRVYSQWAKHDRPKPIPWNPSKQPLCSFAPWGISRSWLHSDAGSPTSLLGASLSYLLCEVWEQTHVKCCELWLAPSKNQVWVPRYLPAMMMMMMMMMMVIMSQIATGEHI